jgi:hypothetical protein
MFFFISAGKILRFAALVCGHWGYVAQALLPVSSTNARVPMHV